MAVIRALDPHAVHPERWAVGAARVGDAHERGLCPTYLVTAGASDYAILLDDDGAERAAVDILAGMAASGAVVRLVPITPIVEYLCDVLDLRGSRRPTPRDVIGRRVRRKIRPTARPVGTDSRHQAVMPSAMLCNVRPPGPMPRRSSAGRRLGSRIPAIRRESFVSKSAASHCSVPVTPRTATRSHARP